MNECKVCHKTTNLVHSGVDALLLNVMENIYQICYDCANNQVPKENKVSEPARIIIDDVDWTKKLEEDYEHYMEQCFDSVDDGPEDFKTLSGDIFCGCQTCITREQLFFLVPKIIQGYKEGRLTIEE
jgi:hypothetical protein